MINDKFIKGDDKVLSKKFICATKERNTFIKSVNAPYIRKNFELSNLPTELFITVSALGFYEIYINGKHITKGKLAPYISNPNDIYYYDKYDILPFVKKGKNTLAFILGNGFKNCVGGFCWEIDKAEFVGPPQIAFAIGGVINDKPFVIEADTNVKTYPSPILFDDYRTGCHYDARLEMNGWNLPEFDDSKWNNVFLADTPKGKGKLCTAPPVECYCELKPVEVRRAELDDTFESRYEFEGVKPRFPIQYSGWLYDFGENNTGVIRLELKNTRPGQIIELQHCEYINHLGKPSYNNTFFIPDGYSQRDIYICKGAEVEIFEPYFTYHGFRYCFITGLDDEQATESAATFCLWASEHKSRGGFTCSDDRINSLQDMCRRSDISNMIYFPTDCPQREKNGWTGDVTVSAEQFLLNFDFDKSLVEWLRNVCAAQNDKGMFPAYVPSAEKGYRWGNGPIWDNVITELPYQLLRYTGDITSAKECAVSIIKYLHYADTKRNDEGLLEYGLGDWLKPKNELPVATKEFVDSTMIYVLCAQAKELFQKLGMAAEQNYAKTLAEDIKNAVCKKYINNKKAVADGGIQTSQVLALYFDLFDEAARDKAANNLIVSINENNNQHDCGMIGIRYLFHALSKAGYTDKALEILLSEGTGYGEFLKHSLTTLPESFDQFDKNGDTVRRSLNHHFMGDISHFFISEIAGIHVNDDFVSAVNIDIKPNFVKELTFAQAHFENDLGLIKTRWERKDKLILSVTKTKDICGLVILPEGYCFKDKSTQKAIGNFEAEIYKIN